jgi:hypothetical protein
VVIAGANEALKRSPMVPEQSGTEAKPTGRIEIALPGAVHVTVRGRVEERMLRAVLGALRSA